MGSKEPEPRSAEVIVLPDGGVEVPLPGGKRMKICGCGNGNASHSSSWVAERLAALKRNSPA